MFSTQPIQIPIHLAPNSEYVYIPDPDPKYSEYRYLTDKTSKKNVLFIPMENKEKDKLDASEFIHLSFYLINEFNEFSRKINLGEGSLNNVHGYLKKMKAKWPNYEILLIHVMGLE